MRSVSLPRLLAVRRFGVGSAVAVLLAVQAVAIPSAIANGAAGIPASFEADGGLGNGPRLDSGGISSCLVLPSGDIDCWGANVDGDLGNGGRLTSPQARPVVLLHNAVSVSVGHADEAASCATMATGTVSCWGDNTHAQLGSGTSLSESPLPVGIVGVANAIQVAEGGDHACVLLVSGAVQCWGGNEAGQLGAPAGSKNPTPTAVPGITGATAVAVGYAVTCALLATGSAQCWGSNASGQLGNAGPSTAMPISVVDATGHPLSGIKAIALGTAFGCALLTAGTVQCWGDDAYGQLGNGGTVPGSSTFHAVAVTGLTGVASIALGDRHACAVLAAGTVWCWGSDAKGELGSGTTNSSKPIQVGGVSGAVEASAGFDFSCARMAAGSILCWGDNTWSQLARPTHLPGFNGPGIVVGNFTGGLVEAGGFHSCALLVNRTVQCWGADDKGQLGNGATVSSGSGRVTVSGLTNVFALSAGTSHTCAIVIGGQAYCWGANDHGQIGNGTAGAGTHVDGPVKVTGLTNAIAISAGGDHSCAVKVDLTAVCWGGNETDQLGNAGLDSPVPTAVLVGSGAGQPITGIVSISAGSGHSCATDRSGGAWCWGNNGNGQVGQGDAGFEFPTAQRVLKSTTTGDFVTNAIDVLARYASSCLVDIAWQVRCWGWNGYGELGQGGGGDLHVATLVPGLDGVAGIGPSSNHGVHVCAVLADTTARCWGANDQGQVGTGFLFATEPSPATVVGLTGAVQVSVGFQHSCAQLSNGTAKCWGSNSNGRLGSAAPSQDPTPTFVTGFNVGTRGLEVDAGTSHTCAVVANGTGKCWGSNGSGRLGDGTTTNRPTPVTVSGLSGATAISAGGAHTCALLASGAAKCWGYGAYGQLGVNSTTSHSTPVTVSGLTGAIAISPGGNHTCALLSNGTVRCWGLNSSGQLGDGTTTNRLVPVTVKTSSTVALTGVVAISAGTSHTCALLSNGTVRCWGAGANGRLGNGSTSNRPYASTSVSGVTTSTAASARFTAISAGGAHACGRVANGTVKCWGAGASGRLGNASTADHSTPVAVSGLTSVSQISAGGAHTCALIANGTAKCWGYNAYGQLGSNSTTSKSTPVTVSGLSGASSISAGGNHTTAGLATGGLRAWGLNTSGQVGDGTTTNRLTPRGVSGF